LATRCSEARTRWCLLLCLQESFRAVKVDAAAAHAFVLRRQVRDSTRTSSYEPIHNSRANTSRTTEMRQGSDLLLSQRTFFLICDKETTDRLEGANKENYGSRIQPSTVLMRSSIESSLTTAALQRSSAYLFPFPCVDVVTSGCGMLTHPRTRIRRCPPATATAVTRLDLQEQDMATMTQKMSLRMRYARLKSFLAGNSMDVMTQD
jgi:hypothetical protein